MELPLIYNLTLDEEEQGCTLPFSNHSGGPVGTVCIHLQASQSIPFLFLFFLWDQWAIYEWRLKKKKKSWGFVGKSENSFVLQVTVNLDTK